MRLLAPFLANKYVFMLLIIAVVVLLFIMINVAALRDTATVYMVGVLAALAGIPYLTGGG